MLLELISDLLFIFVTGIITLCITLLCFNLIFMFFHEKKNKNEKKIMISIEGSIGVGKSSVMNLLEKKIKNAEFIYEPVEEWHTIVDKSGKDILQTFYDDKTRWSYTFQNIAYVTRMNHIIDKIMNSDKKYIILDRSLQADLNTFAKMLYNSNHLSLLEWNAYGRWNTFFENFYGNKVDHKIIYLRCEPEIAFERIKLRGRVSEKEIPLSYLQDLHKYHDEWLLKKDNVLLLDVNDDFVQNTDKFKEMYRMIFLFI